MVSILPQQERRTVINGTVHYRFGLRGRAVLNHAIDFLSEFAVHSPLGLPQPAYILNEQVLFCAYVSFVHVAPHEPHLQKPRIHRRIADRCPRAL
ncbi:hypothetical protein KIF59_07005 [Enterobacter cloacae subsp. cloacae]|nr:hypothetical protein [Enterobacter cloacae subsp. cloacae]